MVDTTEVEGGPSQETAENQAKNKSRSQESPSSARESGPLADTRPQRSTEEILEIAKEKAKAAGEEIPENAYKQYLRGIRKYHQDVAPERTPLLGTEKPPTVEKRELKESNDVFFRDQHTGSPDRLHRNISIGPQGEKETEPVILPPIPENWIVKVPVGLGGGEQHYRLSKSEDAKKAKEKLGLGMISATGRGIMIVDFVPQQEVPKLEPQGYKIVHIDEVHQKLIEGETYTRSEKPKVPKVEVPEGLVGIWEYRPTEPTEYNLKQLPILIPPLDEIERDGSKTPIFEVYLPKGEKEYYTPITATMMLARAQHEFKNKVSGISPEDILLVTKTPESTVKDRLKKQGDKFEKISVSKAIREYQESKSKKKPA